MATATKTKPAKKAATKSNRAADILAENVANLMDSDTYKKALAFRRSFHKYSFANMFLILTQCPEASLVAGYRKWQECGRQVSKGQKSIAILAPLVKKDKETGETKCYGFRSVNVFDVSQTEGEEIPAPPKPQAIVGDSEAIRDAIATLTKFATDNDFTVTIHNIDAAHNGCYKPATKEIEVDATLSPAHQLKTLIHEIAHGMFDHGGDDSTADSYNVGELQAESTAFLVCDALGLDTGDYSFAYLAGWADNVDQIIPAVDVADKLATKLIEAVAA